MKIIHNIIVKQPQRNTWIILTVSAIIFGVTGYAFFTSVTSPLPFDAQTWKAIHPELSFLPGKRLRMLEDLQSRILHAGMSFEDVIEILGTGPIQQKDPDTKTVEYILGIQNSPGLFTYHFLTLTFTQERLEKVEYSFD